MPKTKFTFGYRIVKRSKIGFGSVFALNVEYFVSLLRVDLGARCSKAALDFWGVKLCEKYLQDSLEMHTQERENLGQVLSEKSKLHLCKCKRHYIPL